MRRGSAGATLALALLLAVLAFAAGYYLGSKSALPTPSGGEAPQAPVGTKVYIINDRDYYPTLLRLIERANSSIYVAMYEFKSDTDEVSRVLEALIAKAKSGVDVKVVLENTVDVNELTYRRLLDNRVPVKYDSRAVTTHAKLIVIDGKYVIVGSHNWSYMAFMRNHEASVLIEDPAIADAYTAYFMKIWSGG